VVSHAWINYSDRILPNPYIDLAERRDDFENASITSNARITTAPLFDAANRIMNSAVTLQGCAVSTDRFLKQRAVNIAVSGSYALANWYDPQGKPRNFACRTTRVSPFRMIVDVPVVGKLGDPITSYFSDFGKLEGFISDTTARAFLIELEMTRSMRVKLADNSPGWKGSRKIPVSVTPERMRASFRKTRIRP
jgi:hypothetical protein